MASAKSTFQTIGRISSFRVKLLRHYARTSLVRHMEQSRDCTLLSHTTRISSCNSLEWNWVYETPLGPRPSSKKGGPGGSCTAEERLKFIHRKTLDRAVSRTRPRHSKTKMFSVLISWDLGSIQICEICMVHWSLADRAGVDYSFRREGCPDIYYLDALRAKQYNNRVKAWSAVDRPKAKGF